MSFSSVFFSSLTFGFMLNLDRWWYARDPNTGREGVIPASYLY